MMRLFVFYCIKSSDVCAGRKMIEERRRGKERKSVYIYIYGEREKEKEKKRKRMRMIDLIFFSLGKL